MATIYVGPTSAGAADGTSWSNRYGNLNAAEDRPVAANDTVLVGPGVYRETLTVDVSGSSGQPITYIADVTGANTDGVGGVVRVTGSNNDQTATRANCISSSAKDYRTFRGFLFDFCTGIYVDVAGNSSNWVMEECAWINNISAVNGLVFTGTGVGHTVQNCLFLGRRGDCIQFTHTTTVDNTGNVVQNCIICGATGSGIRTDRVGGITVKNCTIFGMPIGVRVQTALTVGQAVTVNNCIIFSCSTSALTATVTGEILEDYNSLSSNPTDRQNTATGANSNTYPPLLNSPILFNGTRYPWIPYALSNWSQVKGMGAPGLPSDDFFGTFRPTSGSKGSWGAIQYVGQERETTTTRSSSVASIKIPDWGGHQIWVPTTNTSTTISVYVYRETDYSGTLPRMVIKQPSQSDRTTTDTGSAATWNQLTDTFTPSANTDYVVVELQSLNTATSGNYDVFFDDLTVS